MKNEINSENQNSAKFFNYFSYFVLICVLPFFCTLILKDANWTLIGLGDDYQIASTTAIGKPSHSYTGNGRFWPLGLCDYSLLLLIPYGTTVTAHFLYNCVTMIISSLLFFDLLKKITAQSKYSYLTALFGLTILFSASGFLLIHMSCIYPEREMLLMLAFFCLFYWKAVNEKANEIRNYGIAFFAAVYLTYLKEPVFGLWLIFAISNFIFRKNQMSNQNRKFNIALVINSGIWILIYIYRSIFRDHGNRAYATIDNSLYNLFPSLKAVLCNDPFFGILIVLAIFRFVSLITEHIKIHEKTKSSYDIFTDSALFAGLGYGFAYLLLNLNFYHYCFPSIVLGIPAFVRFLSKQKRVIQQIAVLCVVICSLFSIKNSMYIVNLIIEHRKNDPKIFAQLIDEYRDGEQIFYVTEKGQEAEIVNARDNDHMKFRRYQIFLDYYFGKKFPIVRTADYEKINENTVVICSTETIASKDFTKISEQMKKNKIELSQSIDDLGTKIFRAKN